MVTAVVLPVPSGQLSTVPQHFSGITVTHEYGKPYTVWLDGQIERFVATEEEAQQIFAELIAEQA